MTSDDRNVPMQPPWLQGHDDHTVEDESVDELESEELSDDDELSEADAGLLEEFGGAVDFLKNLDKKGIMRYVCHLWHCIIVPQFMQEQKGDRSVTRANQTRPSGCNTR